MIPIQPVGWWHYLHRHKLVVPSTITHLFYTSWEDALWELQKFFKYPSGSVVLVPSFFCGDVVVNMQAHGFKCVWYPVDRNFQINPSKFALYLHKYQPQVVVIFHTVGMTNQLFANAQEWLPFLPAQTLLLEDCVHRVIDPTQISFLTDRHVLIDSLRKVVPLMGSNVYGTKLLAPLSSVTSAQPLWYTFQVVFWWIAFQLALLFSRLPQPSVWQRWWNLVAEKLMLRGYDVIGDSQEPSKGLKFFKWLSLHLNRRHIASSKRHQMRLYQQLLRPIWHTNQVFALDMPEADVGLMRAFPVGLNMPEATSILQKLRQKNLITRFELNDSPWSQQQKVIYLPLGPHLQDRDIREVARIVCQVILPSQNKQL